MTVRVGQLGVPNAVVSYCVIPRDLAPTLHERLRHHFRTDPTVEVIVERRAAERRGSADRRAAAAQGAAPSATAPDRRRIRSRRGRRSAERRATLIAVGAPALPRRARAHAQRLLFVERLEPTGKAAEDADTTRLVARIQTGDTEAFAILYMRYFDRVYGYLRVLLRDAHAAEDVAQQVFAQVLSALPGFDLERPFWVWLFVIMRNSALNELRRRGRLQPEDPSELDRRRERGLPDEDAVPDGLAALSWVSDRELYMLVERLPLAQRQVLLMRYMLDLSNRQIAAVLDRSAADVAVLHHRALAFLRGRLAALGHPPRHARRARLQPLIRKAPVLRSRRFALLP